jgi:hypothetical protein
MNWPHFSYWALGFSFALCAVGFLTGIEAFFLLAIAVSTVSLVATVVEAIRS